MTVLGNDRRRNRCSKPGRGRYFSSPRPTQPPWTWRSSCFDPVARASSRCGRDLLLFKVSPFHSGTPQPVGLLWTRYRPVADTSTWKHNTHNRHPWTRRDSNPQSQQASGCRPLLTPHDHLDRLCRVYKDTNIRHLFIRNHNASYIFRPLRSLPQGVHECIKTKCTVQLTTLLTRCVRVTQICVCALQLWKTDDAHLRF